MYFSLSFGVNPYCLKTSYITYRKLYEVYSGLIRSSFRIFKSSVTV